VGCAFAGEAPNRRGQRFKRKEIEGIKEGGGFVPRKNKEEQIGFGGVFGGAGRAGKVRGLESYFSTDVLFWEGF
jgi:hypothetical protein